MLEKSMHESLEDVLQSNLNHHPSKSRQLLKAIIDKVLGQLFIQVPGKVSPSYAIHHYHIEQQYPNNSRHMYHEIRIHRNSQLTCGKIRQVEDMRLYQTH